jgi:GNAT superfamily N-acetyltransferase
MIQKQTWKDEIRILITDEKNLGSVQISIPLYVSDIFAKADALIYALFVDNNHRRQGVAQRLLQLAEQQAKLNGVKTIGLDFNKDESDSFVFEWYLNNGYKPFSKKSSLLIKKLED